MLTKEGCLKALEDIASDERCYKLDECSINGKCKFAEETVNCDYFKYMHLKRLIEEHFELKRKFRKSVLRYDALLEEYGKFRWNPPLKFEELKEGMWLWDNFYKSYDKLYGKWISDGSYIKKGNYISFKPSVMGENYQLFEENRFFRKQVDE